MKATLSPLAAALRGSTRTARAANRHGVQVIGDQVASWRNPNSTAQKVTRAAVAMISRTWRHLPAGYQAAWRLHQVDRTTPAPAAFCQRNVPPMRAGMWEKCCPANAAVNPVAAVSTAWVAGNLVVSWQRGGAAAGNKASICTFRRWPATSPGAVAEDQVVPLLTDETADISAGSISLAHPAYPAGSFLRVFLSVKNPTTGAYSESLFTDAADPPPPFMYTHVSRVKMATEGRHDTIVFADDAELKIALPGGGAGATKTYKFRLLIFVSVAGTAPDIKVRLRSTVGSPECTLSARAWGTANDAITAGTTIYSFVGGLTAELAPNWATNPVLTPVEMEGTIRVGAANTEIVLQWAQRVSGATTTYVVRDSFVDALEIPQA